MRRWRCRWRSRGRRAPFRVLLPDRKPAAGFANEPQPGQTFPGIETSTGGQKMISGINDFLLMGIAVPAVVLIIILASRFFFKRGTNWFLCNRVS